MLKFEIVIICKLRTFRLPEYDCKLLGERRHKSSYPGLDPSCYNSSKTSCDH